jgi:hypothetical protein
MYITLTATNKRVTVGQYVKAVKFAKENLDREFNEGLITWWPTSGRDIIGQFLAGVHDRINRAIPYHEISFPESLKH